MFELWCIWDFLRQSNTCVLQGEKISKVLQIGHLRLVISILCQLAPSGQRKGHLVHFSAVCQLVENYFFRQADALGFTEGTFVSFSRKVLQVLR